VLINERMQVNLIDNMSVIILRRT